MVLVASINKSHVTESAYIKYDNWKTTLPPSPVFLQHDASTYICRKHALLNLVNVSVVQMLRQVRRRIIRTIMRQRTDTTNHDINIAQLRHACQTARPRILSTPQLCIVATYLQNPGEDPIMTQAMITLE